MPKSPPSAPRSSARPVRRAACKGDVLSSEQVRRRILKVVRAIAVGQVACCKEIAQCSGLPGRARLVARVLSANDDPQLPWHRVLRSDGRIALREGSAGYREPCQQLRAEGVQVERGLVRLASAVQQLDATVWGPS